jgi:hypothetical protein
MNGQSLDTLKPSAHSSQNRYLDGAAATPNSCFGKRPSSTDVPSVDATLRLHNTLPDAQIRVDYNTPTP